MSRLAVLFVATLIGGCATTAPAQRTLAGPEGEAPPPRLIALFTAISHTVGNSGEAVDIPALVPLACYEEGRLAGGTLCLGMVPGRSELAMGQAADQVNTVGRVKPHCEGQITRQIALGLADFEPGTYAIWPAGAHHEFSPVRPGGGCQGWCSFNRTGHPRVRASPALRRRLAKALSPVWQRSGLDVDPKDLVIVQRVQMDLDGDGAAERLVSVAVRSAEQEYAFAFSALVLANGKRPSDLWVLRRQDTAAVLLRGAIDLDQDGTRELWLMLSPTTGGGEAHEVVTLVPGKQAALIGGYGCYPAGR